MNWQRVLDYALGHQAQTFGFLGGLFSVFLAILLTRRHLRRRTQLWGEGDDQRLNAWSQAGPSRSSGERGDLLYMSYAHSGSQKVLKFSPRSIGVAIVLMSVGLVVGGTAVAAIIGRTNPIPKTSYLDTGALALDKTKPNLIIFIHGWRGDSNGTWLRFPNLVRNDERFKDTHVIAVDYPVYVARRNLTIGETASWLSDNLEGNGVEHYSKIAIIAHSIGGLVSRKIVLRRRPSLHTLGLLVEVATPHLGTESYAQLADTLGIPIPGNDIVLEVKQGSDWLRELSNDWNDLEPKVPTQCFTSPNDNLVPSSSAIFQCDKYHFLPGFGHTEMVKPENSSDDRYSEPIAEIDRFLHPHRDPALQTELASPPKKQRKR